MKKFTLMAGLVALATVGSVFAAWTFNSEGKVTTDTLEGGVGVQLTDKQIITSDISGVLEITKTGGNGTVEVVQGIAGQYNMKFVDESNSDKEQFKATYTAGIGELTNDFDYTITFNFKVTYDDEDISGKNASVSFSTSGENAISFATVGENKVLTATTDLSALLNQIATTPITMKDVGSEDVNTVAEMKSWLSTFVASELKIEVSAALTHAPKSSS